MNHNARIAVLYLIVVLVLLGAILWDLAVIPGQGGRHTAPVNRGGVQAVTPRNSGEKAGSKASSAGMRAEGGLAGRQETPRTSETVTSPGLGKALRATPAL